MPQIFYRFFHWVGGNNDFKTEKMTNLQEERIDLWDLELNPLKWHRKLTITLGSSMNNCKKVLLPSFSSVMYIVVT